MAKSMRERYETARKRIRESDEISDPDRELILEFLDANDPNRNTYQMPDGETKSDATLARYAREIHTVASDLELELSEATPYEINRLMDGYLTGSLDGVKDGGLAGGTVRNRQGPLRRFYYYHDDLETARDDIHMAEKEETPVDERDMFDAEEVHDLREEAKQRGTRDWCLVDLLLYTGQRRSAILNLRLKDVDPDKGIFYLNDDDGDLKGANGKRPLLGARKAVRSWERQHPTGDPEDYLITHKHDQSGRDGVVPGDKLNPSTVYRQLQRIGDAAGVDKPVNAHNFRHYFVTVCKRDYGMDDATIKHLIGHRPDSTVMERTYQHLTDEDYIQAAEEKAGYREPDEDSPLTPAHCDRCDEPLEGNWKSCPYCGYTYTPDAQDTAEQIESDMKDSYKEVDPDDGETMEKVDQLDKLLDDPELKAALLEKLQD